MYKTGDNVSVLLCVVVGGVIGVTQLHDVVYIVCDESSAIIRFNARTHERLTDITVKDLRMPWDIAACEQTYVVYVADRPLTDVGCVRCNSVTQRCLHSLS